MKFAEDESAIPFSEFFGQFTNNMAITTIPAPLNGKVAIVTGGSKGIGRETALNFARKGCSHIAITYVQDSAAAAEVLKAVAEISPDCHTIAIKADVKNREFGKEVVQQSLSKLGIDHIDILVSDAGVQDIDDHVPASQMNYEHFQKIMIGQAWAPLQLSLEAIKYMSAGGRVIMNSSGSSKMANGDPFIMHSCSKAAMDSNARNLAVIYGPSKGITVNSIGCGCTDTESLRKSIQSNGPEFGKLVENLSPLKRPGRPEEVANIYHLCQVLKRVGSTVRTPILDLVTFTHRESLGNQVPANGGMMLELQG